MIHKQMFPKIKEGIHKGLEYLVKSYGFVFCEELLETRLIGFSSEEIEVVCKNDIYIYIHWNIYEGINYEIRELNGGNYEIKLLRNYYEKFIPIKNSDNLEEINRKRREWFSQYKDYDLMKKYEKGDLIKYYEYIVLTELRIVENYHPEIFEKGILPNN